MGVHGDKPTDGQLDPPVPIRSTIINLLWKETGSSIILTVRWWNSISLRRWYPNILVQNYAWSIGTWVATEEGIGMKRERRERKRGK